jgi:hypothetical protein
MAKSCSFDIVSEVNMAEVQNAVNQAVMEIRQRYDFKGSKSELKLEEKESQLVLVSDDEYKLKSVIDVLQSKLVRREVSLKALDYGKVEQAGGNTVRQNIKLHNLFSFILRDAILKFYILSNCISSGLLHLPIIKSL